MQAATDIPAWVRDYIMVPNLTMGRDHFGCDCWGLVRLALIEQFGVVPPRYDDVEDSPSVHEALMCRGFSDDRYWRKLCDSTPRQAGDVAQIVRDSYASHVGIFVTPVHLMHMAEAGCVVCDIRHGILDGRIRNVYRPSTLCGDE